MSHREIDAPDMSRTELEGIICAGSIDIAARLSNGINIIHWTVENAPDLLLGLLSMIPPCADLDKDGNTPIHLAIKYDTTALKYLIKAGFPLNVRDSKGRTPLRRAAGRFTEATRLLIDAKADVNYADYNNLAPLHVATLYNDTTLQWIIDAKADINAINSSKNTALHIAMRHCRPNNIIQMLLDNKADLNPRNGNFDCPVHIAARKHPDGVSLLIKANADCIARDRHGHIPLYIALKYNSKRLGILYNMGQYQDEHICTIPSEVIIRPRIGFRLKQYSGQTAAIEKENARCFIQFLYHLLDYNIVFRSHPIIYYVVYYQRHDLVYPLLECGTLLRPKYKPENLIQSASEFTTFTLLIDSKADLSLLLSRSSSGFDNLTLLAKLLTIDEISMMMRD